MNKIDLGFDSYLRSISLGIEESRYALARVVAEHRELYRIKNSEGEYAAKITGKLMHEACLREDYPAVGDWVDVGIIDENQAIIKEIMPRKTTIRKRHGDKIQIVAANVDSAFIVESVDRDYNLNRLERYCALCLQEKITPVIIINKIDLITEEDLSLKLSKIKHRLDKIDVISTSVSVQEGLDQLKSYIQKGATYCFLGSSGVGKSSIINKLIGEEATKTAEIGKGTNRGKHTTTHREMFFLPEGGILIDNPGMREVGLADFESGVAQIFDNFETLAKHCKFSDCRHIDEPGCAILEVLAAGRLDEDQYENYLRIKKEVVFYEMSEPEERSRKFGKFIKKSLKQLEELER